MLKVITLNISKGSTIEGNHANHREDELKPLNRKLNTAKHHFDP